MKIEVSNGEIVDKLTILQIKKINITESENVNKKLWDVEEHIRKKENKKEFDDEFVNLARNVYILNDKRAEIKKRINTITNSNFIEEKSY